MKYIYNETNWPSFTWDKVRVLESLSRTKYAQGILLGKVSALGFGYQEEATLNTLIEDVTKSSEIEGEILKLLSHADEDLDTLFKSSVNRTHQTHHNAVIA